MLPCLGTLPTDLRQLAMPQACPLRIPLEPLTGASCTVHGESADAIRADPLTCIPAAISTHYTFLGCMQHDIKQKVLHGPGLGGAVSSFMEAAVTDLSLPRPRALQCSNDHIS